MVDELNEDHVNYVITDTEHLQNYTPCYKSLLLSPLIIKSTTTSTLATRNSLIVGIA
jgi:hypothetical protein